MQAGLGHVSAWEIVVQTGKGYEGIAANLVTGFLGTGKTTAIRALLAQRPRGERWAVLVNEFGEVGIDGDLLDASGVGVEQVPGGCICCVSAQMFTVGLNRLIRQENPDRVLIEPTGLGHPAQILRTLTTPPYERVLDLRATITVVDARHLASPRHREHPNWIDQVALADVLVANKADLYAEADITALEEHVRQLTPPRPHVVVVRDGALDVAHLDRARLDRGAALFPEARAFLAQAHSRDHDHHGHDDDHGHDHASPAHSGDPRDWVVVDRQADGYVGRSWLLPADVRWRHDALAEVMAAYPAERMKGMVPTEQGWQTLNCSDGVGTLQPASNPEAECRPRLEVIQPATAGVDLDQLDRALRALPRVHR